MGRVNVELLVLGHLEAAGTAADPILFTSAANTGASQWSGLAFDGGTGNLDYATVRYGGNSNSVLFAITGNGQYGSNVTARNVPAPGLTIAHSQVRDGCYSRVSYPFVGLYLADSPATISDTTFSGNGINTSSHALYTTGANTVLIVTNSSFQNNSGYGIVIASGNVTVACSSVTNNGSDGIYMGGGQLFVVSSGLSGNAGYGLRNTSDAQVDARYTWWGAISGPTHASNPGGTGEEVSSNVRFEPWLGAAPAACALTQATHTLSAGWNLLGLTVATNPATYAEVGLDQVEAQGGNAGEVDRWLNGSWDAHIHNLPFNDFELELGKGYFVKSVAGSAWQRSGWPLTAPLVLKLVAGWNLVALPWMPPTFQAEDVLTQIQVQGGLCSEIDGWLSGGWTAHIKGLPFNNFALSNDLGYFIKCTQPTLYVPGLP